MAGLRAGSAPRVARKANDPAVILFTSGSEGTPKGVVLSHRNILANAAQALARVDANADDKVFNVLPVFHSFGLTGGMMMPLLGGIPIFMYPSPLHYRIVPELIYQTGATILFGTDTFLTGYARSAHAYDFRSLRLVHRRRRSGEGADAAGLHGAFTASAFWKATASPRPRRCSR
jgi:acyl-[acyl-carrier-protein]-phospholipid O-acyltransferase/long-chain-fatty-acid--[acyl-carrier-protein] ligase